MGGEVRANGRALEAGEFMRWGTVAPKDDALLEGLTPRELTTFAARMRGRHRRPIETAVQDIVKAFELGSCADTATKLVSGGQRRRTSLAVELVHSPSVCLCDEPTSGLDSRAARLVAEKFRVIARTTRTTVVATIHQPSAELFAYFDDVVVVANGRVAFAGSMPRFKAHFATDLAAFPGANAAEVVLDRVAEDPRGAANRWVAAKMVLDAGGDAKRGPSFPLGRGRDADLGRRPSRVECAWALFQRTALNVLREQASLQARASIVVALFLSAVFYREQNTQARGELLVGSLYLCVVYFGVFVATTTVSVVATEIPTLRREHSNGVYAAADFLGARCVVVLLHTSVVALAFSAVYFHLTHRGYGGEYLTDLARFLAAIYLLGCTVGLQGLLLGAAAPSRRAASLAVAPAIVPLLLFAGYFFQRNDLTKTVQRALLPLWYLSYFRYSFALLVATYFRDGSFRACAPDDYCPFSSYAGIRSWVHHDAEVKHNVVIKDYLDIPLEVIFPGYYVAGLGFLAMLFVLNYVALTHVTLARRH